MPAFDRGNEHKGVYSFGVCIPMKFLGSAGMRSVQVEVADQVVDPVRNDERKGTAPNHVKAGEGNEQKADGKHACPAIVNMVGSLQDETDRSGERDGPVSSRISVIRYARTTSSSKNGFRTLYGRAKSGI